MGLNWAAALNNVDDGIGRIAQVRYSEFMRQDENARRDREREIDFQRQMNLARFQLQGQKEIQQGGFTHAEKLHSETMDYNRTRAEADDRFRERTLDNQELQIRQSGAASAAAAKESAARLRILEDQVAQAEKDRDFQAQKNAFELPLNSANAQITDLMKARTEAAKNMGDTSQIDAEIATLRQTANAASNGLMHLYKQNGLIKLTPEQEQMLNTTMATPNENGQLPTFMEAFDRAVLRPMVVPDTPGQPDDARKGPQIPAGLRIPGMDAEPTAQPQAPAAEPAQAAGMPVVDRFLDSSGRIVNKIDLQVAMRQLDPRTIERLKRVGRLGKLSEEETRHIRSLGYEPDFFRSMFRSDDY